jgi:predicted RNase H-like HicB family nuclease
VLTDYIAAAMKRAHYELLPDGEGIFAEIVGLPGVWANGDTVEGTREDLRLALEGWIALALARNIPIPEVDGVRIAPALVA